MNALISAVKLRFLLAVASLGVATLANASAAPHPTPTKIVSPTGLPRWAENSTVNVVLTIDADGVPHEVEMADWTPSELAAPIVAAVSEWRFNPATVDGKPVAMRVVLPVCLVRESMAN